jgi:hypothetical protein
LIPRQSSQRINSHLLLYLYVGITWFFLAQITANLGIAVRQKWMVLPALLLLIVSAQRDRRLAGSYAKTLNPKSAGRRMSGVELPGNFSSTGQ